MPITTPGLAGISPGIGWKLDVVGLDEPPEIRGASTGRGAAGPCAGRTPKTGRGKAPLCDERDVCSAPKVWTHVKANLLY